MVLLSTAWHLETKKWSNNKYYTLYKLAISGVGTVNRNIAENTNRTHPNNLIILSFAPSICKPYTIFHHVSVHGCLPPTPNRKLLKLNHYLPPPPQKKLLKLNHFPPPPPDTNFGRLR